MEEKSYFFTIMAAGLLIMATLYRCSSYDPVKTCKDICGAHDAKPSGYDRKLFMIECYCSKEGYDGEIKEWP